MKRKPIYRDKLVHVGTEKCATCIFRPGNLMRLEPGRVKGMVELALRNDTAIVCHESLDGERAVCRGFYDRHKDDVFPLRLALMLDRIREVS